MKDDDNTYRAEMRSYVLGIGFATLLTLVAFALVAWHMISREQALIAIAVLALVQIVVHVRYFLHINLSKQKREDLHLILFSTLLLILMAGGTIWLLSNLAQRMMPGMS